MLTWTESARPDPELRVWTAGGDRMLLMQGDRPVLIAKVADYRCNVGYLRTGLYRAPLPRITAEESRRRPPSQSDGWAEYFRARLTTSDAGPLRDGAWAILPAEEAIPGFAALAARDRFGRESVMTDARGTLDWFGMRTHLLPLHAIPSSDQARVKAHRKLAREGLLPPVLTWWVTGLQALVVLDGVARLAAAWAERLPAAVLTLVEIDPARVDADVDQAVSHYEATTAGVRNLTGDRAERAHEHLSRRLAHALDRAQTSGITRAWPLPGGVTEWQVTAAAHGWMTEIGRPQQQ